MKKRSLTVMLALAVTLVFTSCGGGNAGEKTDAKDTTAVNVFAAASLSNVMAEFEKSFEEANPGVDIVINADSSGALLTEIQEGAPCDVFFSAAQKQMDDLEKDGMLVPGTRTNVVNNQLVVICPINKATAVKGLSTIGKASSIALADGSVPAGRYTRIAMISLGLLREAEDPALITTAEVSEQLGGVEVSEQSNVSKVLTAVEEDSCEVGTTYLSDTVGHENSIRVIETVPYEVTGDIIYPVAGIVNRDAGEAETAAAEDFIDFITNDAAKATYQKYGFDTNVE